MLKETKTFPANNFNLDGNGKDIQIEVYEQLIEQLQQENQKYKEVIDKAIEYIKNASYFDGSGMCANDLLEILKGSDK